MYKSNDNNVPYYSLILLFNSLKINLKNIKLLLF